MMALLFIIVITGASIFISIMISPEGSWYQVYVGGIVGFIISGIVLGIINKRRRAKELKEEQSNINPLYKKKHY